MMDKMIGYCGIECRKCSAADSCPTVAVIHTNKPEAKDNLK